MNALALRRSFVAVFVLLVATSASAVISSGAVSILIDADRNAATGCDVTAGQVTYKGIEFVVKTTFDAMLVTGVTKQQCVNGVLGGAVTIDTGGWNVGTGAGTQYLETSFPVSLFGGPIQPSRYVFVAESGTSIDIVDSYHGLPIIFPPDRGPGRHRVVIPPSMLLITRDGNISDWDGRPPLVADAAGTGTPAFRFSNIYSIFLRGDEDFRFDIQVNASAPTARDDSYSAIKGGVLNQAAASGVLANDINPPGNGTMTAVKLSDPLHGTLTLNPNGSFTYFNDGSAAVSDSFTYKAHNSAGDSNSATVTITIIQGNAPAFTSANATTFRVGVAGTFLVTTSGTPQPSLTRSGSALPTGVSFTDNGNGTATLSGTPAAGTGGTYTFQITATNIVGQADQTFTLTVQEAPAITSANTTTFIVGMPGSFTVTASGFPAPTISESGALPNGVIFNSITHVLGGTPGAGSGGSYSITFTATNALGSSPAQNFTLNVNQAPAITSANSTTFTVGSAGTFTVTATGVPAPALSESGALPNGVTFNAGTHVLSGTPAAGTGGTYNITFGASNGVTPNAAQSFVLTVNQAPAITSANTTTFIVGTPGLFTVTASGFPAPTISESGTLPNGVSFNLITHVLGGTPAAGTAGSYPITFTGTNAAGSSPAQNFTLIVSCPAATTSITAPANVTSGRSYTADVPSQLGSTYSWTISNGNITAGANARMVTFTAGAAGSGGTTAPMTLSVTETNSLGCPASDTKTLTVYPAPQQPTITVASATCAGSVGNPASVVAHAGMSYSWSVSNGTFTTPTNTTSVMFTAGVAGPLVLGATETNAIGDFASNSATVTVNPPPSQPAITFNPAQVCANTTGNQASVPLLAGFTYAWTIGGNGSITAGANTDTLTFSALDGGSVTLNVTVTNAFGCSASNSTTKPIYIPVVVTSNPLSQAVCAGAVATFTAAASSNPTPTVKWQVSTDGGGTFNDIVPAETSTTLTVNTTAADNLNQYRAVFNNACGSLPTTAAILTVDQPITISTQPTDQSVTANTPVTFTAASTPVAPVQWQVSTDGGTTFNNILGATSTTLTFSPPLSDNGHKVKAVFTNACAPVETNVVTLTVTCPTITVSPVSLNNGKFGIVYPAVVFTASGGAGTYTFGLTGTLPPGINFTPGTATLDGTPTTTGVFTNIIVTATDTNGCIGTRTFTLTIVPAVNGESYSGVGNTQLVAAGQSSPSTPFIASAISLLANDLGPGLAVVPVTNAATAAGGSITIGSAGDFTYTPPLNITGSDVYTYTVTSNGASANGTVTLTLTNKVWYVKNDFGSGGNGLSSNPFNTLVNSESAVPSAAVGDTIYVMTGDGSTTKQNAGITLKNNQTLFGAGVAVFTVGAITITTPGAGTAPHIGNAAGDGVTLASGNSVKGFTVTGSTGSAIFGTLALGTTALDALTLQNSTAAGLRFDNASGTVTFNTGTITGNTAAGVDIINGGAVNVTYGGNITQTAGAMVNVAGGVGGHSGTLTFNNTGTLIATGGTGLQFDHANGTYNFNGTTTLNGGAAAVLIFNGSTGTFNFASTSSITNPSAIAFNVPGSAPNLTYAGTITQNGGQAVSITGGVAGNCGTQTFSGNMSGNGVGARGILMANCSAGTVTFSGSSLAFTTFTNPGVQLTPNGATVRFTGGNLAINTTSGNGFFANNGGGTVEVTGNNNTVVTTTGIAVQILNNLIGPNGVTFHSVSANGGNNGIVLGSTVGGTFTVTGDGSTAGSGGTIINTTGTAVQIGTVTSLSFMNIAGAGGILGGGTLTVNGVSVSGTSFALLLSTATVNGTFSSVGGTNSGSNAAVTLISVGGNFTASGGTLTGGTAGAPLVNISGGNATIHWQGTITQSFGAALLNVSSTNTGNITFDTGTLTMNPTSTGLVFAAANGTYNFNGTTTCSGCVNGITIGTSTGTFNFGSGVAISDTTGTAVQINGTQPVVLYAGTISQTTPPTAVVITGVTGGNTAGIASPFSIKFSGNISKTIIPTTAISATGNSGGSVGFTGATLTFTTTNGTAVNLASNTGATFTFAAGTSMAITTTTGTGFNATGGGTVNVTGANNTVSSGTGAAVNIQNTTIGSGNVTFRSVSATGGTNGIVLNSTGSGVFNVTGDGTTNMCKSGTTICSGGTIQSTTADGISITSSKVNLSLMWIKNCANSGIKGTTVTGLTLNDVLLQNNTNATGEQAGILVNDLTDSAAVVTRAEVTGSTEDNVRIHNTNTTGTITFTSCTVMNNSTVSGNNGIFFQTNTSGHLTGTVQNSTLNGNRAIALSADSGDASTLSATFLNNTITAGAPNQGNQGIQVSRAATSTLTFNVDTNTVSGMISTLINVFSGSGPGTATGDVKNNICTGSGLGGNQVGIRLFNSGSAIVGFGTMNVNVANNTVSNIDNAYPILGEASGSTGAGGLLKIAVTGNTANVVGGGTALDSIRIQSRNTSTVCATVSGNTTNSGGTGFFGIQLRRANTSVFNLEGLTAGSQTDPTVHDYVVAQNPSGGTVGTLAAVGNASINGVAVNNCGITP